MVKLKLKKIELENFSRDPEPQKGYNKRDSEQTTLGIANQLQSGSNCSEQVTLMTNKTQVKMPSDQGGSYYDYRDQITRLRIMYYKGLIDYHRTLTLELSFQIDEEYIKYLEWQPNDVCEKPGKYIDQNKAPAASNMDQAQKEEKEKIWSQERRTRQYQ